MSGIGPSELIVLVVVGLLILGPERLPRVATQIGRWVGRARRTANQLRYQLEREITLADIEGKKKEKEKEKEQQARTSGEASETADADTPDAAEATEATAEDPSDPQDDHAASIAGGKEPSADAAAAKTRTD